jgi:tetratricopeptide (TPR) repeat protein
MIRKLERTIDLCPGDEDAPRLRLGESLLALGRLTSADEQFRNVLSLDGANARARLGSARVASQRERLDEARSEVAPALRDTRTRKAAYQLLAEIEHRRAQPAAAALALQTAAGLPNDEAWPDPYLDEISRFTTGRDAALERALQLLDRRRNAEAVGLLLTTAQNYPESYRTWFILGLALGGMGRIEEAEQAVRTALRLKDDSGEAHYQLGGLLFAQDRPIEAKEAFQRATQLRPLFAEAHYMLGQCRLQTGEVEEAIAAFRTALRCRPDYVDALAALGELLIKTGRSEDGLLHLRRAAAAKADNENMRRLIEQTEAELRERRF